MKHWLETNPIYLTIIILIVIYIFVADSTNTMAWIALFAGVAGFSNSIWLNHRINKIQDRLNKKESDEAETDEMM